MKKMYHSRPSSQDANKAGEANDVLPPYSTWYPEIERLKGGIVKKEGSEEHREKRDKETVDRAINAGRPFNRDFHLVEERLYKWVKELDDDNWIYEKSKKS